MNVHPLHSYHKISNQSYLSKDSLGRDDHLSGKYSTPAFGVAVVGLNYDFLGSSIHLDDSLLVDCCYSCYSGSFVEVAGWCFALDKLDNSVYSSGSVSIRLCHARCLHRLRTI